MESRKDWPCHPGNYRKGRGEEVEFLVFHYVGATGSAAANARYYGSTPGIGASAHYFVGHAAEGAAVYASVAEGDTAWHVGAKGYVHPRCRNANSIGVELCCHKGADGTWWFDPETLDAAVELGRDIMARYGIDAAHVLRHYDVTGKVCPAPFVNDPAAWETFKARLTAEREGAPGGTEGSDGERTNTGMSELSGLPGSEGYGGREDDMKLYKYVAEMPEWAREAATKAIRNGYIRMDETGAVGVWEPNLQALVWMDRAGMLDEPARKV